MHHNSDWYGLWGIGSIVMRTAIPRLSREWKTVLKNHDPGQPVGYLSGETNIPVLKNHGLCQSVGYLSGETSIPVLKNHDLANQTGNLSGETKIHSEAMTYRTSAPRSR